MLFLRDKPDTIKISPIIIGVPRANLSDSHSGLNLVDLFISTTPIAVKGQLVYLTLVSFSLLIVSC